MLDQGSEMAANYWASTQRRHWLFTREKLAEIREIFREGDKVAHSQFPLPDQRLLNIYFSQRKRKPDMSLKKEIGLIASRTYKAWKANVN